MTGKRRSAQVPQQAFRFACLLSIRVECSAHTSRGAAASLVKNNTASILPSFIAPARWTSAREKQDASLIYTSRTRSTRKRGDAHEAQGRVRSLARAQNVRISGFGSALFCLLDTKSSVSVLHFLRFGKCLCSPSWTIPHLSLHHTSGQSFKIRYHASSQDESWE